MDEVKAMSRAGETVGKAVGSGWLTVRRSARRAGQAGAEATVRAAKSTDRKLTERGVAPQHLTQALSEGAELARQEIGKTTRRTRKKLARTAKHTRKELAKAAKKANKDARKSKPAKRAGKSAKQAKADAKRMKASLKAEAARLKERAREEAVAMKLAETPKKRRRWPKVLLLAVVAGGVAYVVRSRTSAAPQPTPVPEPRPRADSPESASSESSSPNGQPTNKESTKQS
ncbi:hypothetical protein [Actinophytocola gossypii]|uniref:DUF3618 domain-containing protein n=1 Tax=Actinophytocola gossypii TaxID=2812003 RepID=A0ABT2JF81_9PSEU|nr:hypothetical protein [Actinophytocola gossypii]MCT2586538.1 hypothetical protein [Actinophytocola gossypii]